MWKNKTVKAYRLARRRQAKSVEVGRSHELQSRKVYSEVVLSPYESCGILKRLTILSEDSISSISESSILCFKYPSTANS